MLRWQDYISMVNESSVNNIFVLLPQDIGELPVVTADMLGERVYYSFFQAGILFLLENDLVTQITFFMKPEEGFSIYQGEFPPGIGIDNKEKDIVAVKGKPSASGGGKTDMLLGYINRWIKYESNDYVLHIEFAKDGRLAKISLQA